MVPIEFETFTQDEIYILESELYFAEREKALIEREKALIEREKTLAERENALVEREKTLIDTKKVSKAHKKISITYTSNYRGQTPEFEKIGIFDDEKSAIDATIAWLVVNGKGGFEQCDLNETLTDLYDEGNEDDFDEAELIEYMSKKCNTWKELRNVCEKYGNSFFEDDNGWFLKSKKV